MHVPLRNLRVWRAREAIIHRAKSGSVPDAIELSEMLSQAALEGTVTVNWRVQQDVTSWGDSSPDSGWYLIKSIDFSGNGKVLTVEIAYALLGGINTTRLALASLTTRGNQ